MQNITSVSSLQLSWCFLTFGFATIIFYIWIKLKEKRTPPLPPGPIGFPIIGGCLLKMIKNKPTFRWMHQVMQEIGTEIACFRFGNTCVISVTSPELAQEFLKKHDAVFASRPSVMTARLFGNDYLMVALSNRHDQWSKMRRIIVSEVLSPITRGWLHDKRCEEADHLVRYVHKQCMQNPLKTGLVNVRTAAQHYCGNVMRKMVFGKRYFEEGTEDEGPGVEEKEHVDALFTFLFHVFGFAIADFVPWLEVFDLDGYKKIIRNARDIVRKYHEPEISKRAEMWRQGIRRTEEDILDVFINLKDSNNNPLLSIQELTAETTELMLAIIDNPSNAIEWAIAEMVAQPCILDRAYEELDQVVGKNRLVQEFDLPELNYIKACIKEAMRLHPVAPFNLPHVATEDVVVGGYFIPRGSHVLVSRPGLGRNPRVWENPLKYRPGRHFVDQGTKVELTDPKLRMFSFSIGRRGCPGVTLGSTVTTMLLARLVQCFQWRAAPNGPTALDLVESGNNLLMAKPLVLHATPRLEEEVYQQLY